jgi:excinuclease ABC subunit B
VKHSFFHLHTPFIPDGDQPTAIANLVQGIESGEKNQVLLGVTGSGKTFTMAHVIAQTGKTTLVLAPNKTLAAQLYGEMKSFFPENAVEYFVSYYDYYQPEAYVVKSDVYIEKESSINEQIERMRHSATRALIERKDVIVVASVSCIYGLGDIESYREMCITLEVGNQYGFRELFSHFQKLQYKRNDVQFVRGNFRVRGDRVDLFPAHYEDRAWSLSFFGEELESIFEIDALTGKRHQQLSKITVYPNSNYVTPGPTIEQAIKGIRKELALRLEELESQSKLVETQRLRERVRFDLEMLQAAGYCNGIENYSRYLTGRPEGAPPPTLFEYLPKDSLLIVDESHVSIPQLRGMSLGDKARKKTLSDYGFRLPSCKDNRPLSFEEWDHLRPQTIFVSATPGPWELEQTQGVFTQQLIRPTGILDPTVEVHPSENQIDHLMGACRKIVQNSGRVFVTTLTKKMAEDLTTYLWEAGFRVRYMHSDIDTLERIEILQDLRQGVFDILVGINLLREGLDVPECQLVAILDADKEGYLRSRTSLIQTMGRAARNIHGHVILYADHITGSMAWAMEETARRREKQEEYNRINDKNPVPTLHQSGQIIREEELQHKQKNHDELAKNKKGNSLFSDSYDDHSKPNQGKNTSKKDKDQLIRHLTKKMELAAQNLEFEQAARLRDHIKNLSTKD